MFDRNSKIWRLTVSKVAVIGTFCPMPKTLSPSFVGLGNVRVAETLLIKSSISGKGFSLSSARLRANLSC